MDSVHNAIPIQRAMFPREWMTPQKSLDAQYGGPPYGGPPYGGPPPAGPPPTWYPTPAPPPTPPGGPTPAGRGGYEDTRHPKKTPYGPLPQVVQQLREHSGDPHGIREAHVGPPHPSKILPPNGPIFLMLEWRLGEMFPRTSVQVCPGPYKKGGIH